MRSIKPRQTYRDWIKHLLHFVQLPMVLYMLGTVNVKYLERSVKSCLRKERGALGAQLHVTGVEQMMVEGGKWQEFVVSYVTQEKTSLEAFLTQHQQKEPSRFPTMKRKKSLVAIKRGQTPCSYYLLAKKPFH